MLKFLKRLAGVDEPEPVRPAPRRRQPSSSRRQETAPGALPEVSEGNSEDDWAMWQNSIAQSDSQLQSLSFRDSTQYADTQPSELADLDPFAGVKKNRDL